MRCSDLYVVASELIEPSSLWTSLRSLLFDEDGVARLNPVGSGVVCLWQVDGVRVLVVMERRSPCESR